jgi:hypothetical protein
MPAINDLLGGWSAISGSTLIVLGTIATDDFDAWMLPEPLSQGFCAPVFQHVYWLMRLSIEQERSVGMSSSKGEIIHAEDAGSGRRWDLLFGTPEQRIGAHRYRSLLSEALACLTAEHNGNAV